MKKRGLNRRNFLRSAGIIMGLPALDLQAKSAPLRPQRFVASSAFFGMNPEWFFPKQDGKLSNAMAALQPHRDDLTIYSQLDHPGIKSGHAATHSFLSGVHFQNAASMPDGNITLDQRISEVVGSKTRFPSLQLGRASTVTSYPSWTRSGAPLAPMTSIVEIYNTLFVEPDAKSKAEARERLGRGGSILDLVNNQARRLQGDLGYEDKQKLEEYFTSVRDVEKSITQSLEWNDRPRPEVKVTYADEPATFREALPLYYNLMALALQTDSTRAITFDIADFGGPSGLDGVSSGYHTLTHHGKMEGRLEQLKIIETFLIDEFASFLKNLSEKPAANGRRLLDDTIVMFGSGLGNANSHSNRNLPIIVAGGGVNHPALQKAASEQKTPKPACNLFLSILHQLGIEDDAFGTSTGTLIDS